ncbi:hypothetical protein J3458_022493 [Metarhizium acridum]|uniref:uncharacterized protein n=1 Tax=Metarhizium acridum TaxID=92637 RepID=UPI001C6AC2D3|nr:hypothetical protein J3458_022493 [Metarhizium acridum]
MQSRSQADTALTDPLAANNAGSRVCEFRVGNALARDALRCTAASLVASTRHSWQPRPLFWCEAGKHGRKRRVESSTPKSGALDRGHIIRDVRNHRSRVKVPAWSSAAVEASIGVSTGAVLRLIVVLLTEADLGSAKLQKTGLKVRERAFDEALAILEVYKQIVPKLVFRKHLGIAQNYQTILGSGKGNIQTARV